jgi:malate dehydrogenase (oxaloacetate-decarboxylating)(NADP+)
MVCRLSPSSSSLMLCHRRTNGKVVFASGSPYKCFEYDGKKYEPGQGNNMYIFPGIGLGAILCKSKHITDAMVEQAAIALSESLDNEEVVVELVYPRLIRIREISARIALAVIRTSQAEVRYHMLTFIDNPFLLFDLSQDLDQNQLLRRMTDATLLDYIKAKMWHPPVSSPSRL